VEHRAQVGMLEWSGNESGDAGDGSRSGDPVTNMGLEFECSAVRSAGPRIRPADFKRAEDASLGPLVFFVKK
jgi:hypothetical protein